MIQTTEIPKKMTNRPSDVADFAERLATITRNHSVFLSNLFRAVLITENAKRSIRLQILKADNNGRPQVKTLVRELCNTILEYCIPRKQLKQAYEHFKKTGSAQRIMALRAEAQHLFTDISNTGEGGELLLFILTESVLKYPQVLSKMAIKTSSKMHFHGLDGVYISCKGKPSKLRLHFGESKLHKSPSGSVRDATNSIASMLMDEGFIESARRDYYLLNTQADLGSCELEDALKGFLDPLDERFLAPEICAVLLAGHELKDYPIVFEKVPIPKAALDKAQNLVKVLEECSIERGVDRFHIDLFLIPFPDLQVFRDVLLKELGLRNGDLS